MMPDPISLVACLISLVAFAIFGAGFALAIRLTRTAGTAGHQLHLPDQSPPPPTIIITSPPPTYIHPAPAWSPPTEPVRAGPLLLDPGDQVTHRGYNLEKMVVIGGYPDKWELEYQPADPRPTGIPHSSDHLPAPDQLLSSASAGTRASYLAPGPGRQNDTPELVAAARTLGVRQLRSQFGIGYSRARRLVELYQTTQRERGNP